MGLKDNLTKTQTDTNQTTHKDIMRTQKKSAQIYITVSDEEKEHLKALARQNGISVSAFCKMVLTQSGALKKPELKLNLNLENSKEENDKKNISNSADDELKKILG